MHLGNIYAALLSFLSVKSKGGVWILRIEDLDTQRSRRQWAELIEADLQWLGLEWDEGGLEDMGRFGPYVQSCCGGIYEVELKKLRGRVYPCHCTRAEIMAAGAPHESDGRVVYAGTCRPPVEVMHAMQDDELEGASVRLYVPDEDISYVDRNYGEVRVNLARDCGDFVLRRRDGMWAYQFAVVVDDARMGVTEVVRGSDLLLSGAQQTYLYKLLGYKAPEFAHIPLLTDARGNRLSKRDNSIGMDYLRSHYTKAEVLGRLAFLAGLIDSERPVTLDQLLDTYPGK